jgi:transcriptional regulator with XRE-family HTH domain
LAVDLARAAEEARLDRGLSYREVGRSLGISGAQAARLCRGESKRVSVVRTAQLLEVVGLELGARPYPGASPIRDRGHLALLARLRARLHPSLTWRTEQPVIEVSTAAHRDLCAWDAVISGVGWCVGVEAETHVRDAQALQRRIALKQRDGAIDAVLLLLTDSKWHRDLMRSVPELGTEYPVTARAALRALGIGGALEGNALVLL